MHLSSYTGNPAADLKACIDAGFAALQVEHDKLTKQATLDIPTIQKVEPCDKYPSYPNDWVKTVERKNQNSYGYYGDTTPSIEKVESECAAELASWKAFAESTHEKNKPAIEANKIAKEKLDFLLRKVGMPATYYESVRVGKGFRARNERQETPSGWIGDLARIVTHDGYEFTARKHIECEEAVKRYAQERRAILEKEKQKIEQEKVRKESERKLGVYAGMLGLGTEAEWDDVIDAVLKKNKYLALAHGLLQNRNDWNEGPSHAEYAIGNFNVETEVDAEIESCINEHISDWGGDGRVFRDCTWSYDRIFGLVPADIFKLYNEVTEAKQ